MEEINKVNQQRKKLNHHELTEEDFYPPEDKRIYSPIIMDVYGGDNFKEYFKYFYETYGEDFFDEYL